MEVVYLFKEICEEGDEWKMEARPGGVLVIGTAEEQQEAYARILDTNETNLQNGEPIKMIDEIIVLKPDNYK